MAKKLSVLMIMMLVFAGLSYGQVATENQGGENDGVVGTGKVTAPKDAQSASTSANASITVYSGLSITKVHDIDFGKVAAGAGLQKIASNTSNAAGFQITGQPDNNVNITLGASSVTLTSGSNTLTMNTDTPVYNNTNDPTGATDSNGNISLSSAGNLYMFVGGSVNVGATTPSGTYSGTIDVSVAYTGS
ncbi:MAG TPA: DUF4402 domain-containing protein [Bacteroidales bacterium]|nr:DUF4402 domain-containing protein [Bacteroidales bacterium]